MSVNELSKKQLKKLDVENHNTSRQFNSTYKPYSVEYAVDLAKYMLVTSKDFTFVKKITGLTIRDMLHLELIEYYYPYTKKILTEEFIERNKGNIVVPQEGDWIEVPDTSIQWLRRKVK